MSTNNNIAASSVVDTDCLSDVDLQAILDDLLHGTEEFDEFDQITEDLFDSVVRFLSFFVSNDSFIPFQRIEQSNDDQTRSDGYTHQSMESAQTSAELVVDCVDPMIDTYNSQQHHHQQQVPTSPDQTLFSIMTPELDPWLDANMPFCKQEPLVDDDVSNDPVLGTCGMLFDEDDGFALFDGYIN